MSERAVASGVAAGDGDQQGFRAAIALAQGVRDGKAGHSGHADVEQHHVGAEVVHRAQGLITAFDSAHGVAVLLEQQPEAEHGIGIVIGDKYSRLALASHRRVPPYVIGVRAVCR